MGVMSGGVWMMWRWFVVTEIGADVVVVEAVVIVGPVYLHRPLRPPIPANNGLGGGGTVWLPQPPRWWW